MKCTGLEGKESAAAARTNVSIPPACGIYYYEVLILDKGTKGSVHLPSSLNSPNSHVTLILSFRFRFRFRFSARDVRLTRLPGWESQSWGYHGDDGQVFTGGSELPFGKKFTTGDVIGCGIDFTTHRAFYTKGGVFINSVFNDVGAKAEIFPSVGLRSQGESIRANFGQEPFKFDINAYVQQERTRVWRAIQSTPIDVVDDHFQLPPGAKLPSLEPGSMATNKANEPPRKTLKRMNELIYAYLVHHGYSGTARAFRSHPESQLKLTKERGKITSAPTSMSNEEQSMDLDPAPQELGADPSHPHSGTAVEEEEEEEDKEDLAVISRQNIVRAVLSGDIDTAISETSSKYPEVLEVQDGIMLFKLKCRKFVEMILDVAEAYRKEVEVGAGTGTGVEGYRDGRNGKGVGSGESEAEVESVVLPTTASSSSAAAIGSAGSAFPPLSSPTSPMTSTSNGTGNGAGTGGVSGGVFDMDMEVDGDVQSSSHHATNGHGHSAPDSAFFASSSTLPPPSSSTPVPDPTTSIDPSLASSSRHPPPSHLSPQPQLESHPSAPTETSSYQSLFLLARAYGQSLSTTYKHDRRSSIQTSIKRASSLIAFVDPLRAEREEVGSLAGQGARNELAGELNRAILESMGLPTTPALEKMYCQSVAAVTVLGCYGVGAAAFADTRREFLED
ncbi:SPRY-domain-containing protein [Sistotremastrum suecicum HHB10207 ss-3]|uniref:SPRY-domain-containing protein n=1 Tax=Sistotremastrum suecicum HHB10207 ss-3 TaxID=1314776 RepID=A0A166HLB4_9AGAM|nr:SPRY-domain-containing protein [Sistotremastrum suecicum HHB10207 ss-3]